MHEFDSQTRTHRFQPARAAARRENALAALLAAAATGLMLHYGRGERDLTLVLGFAAAAAVLTYAFYEWRARRGPITVEIDDRAISVVDARGGWRLEWSELRRVDHGYYGGERWTLLPRAGRPRALRADGLTVEEAAGLANLIRERMAAADHTTPAHAS